MELKNFFTLKYVIIMIFSTLFALLVAYMYVNQIRIDTALNYINMLLLNYIGILFIIILIVVIYNLQIVKDLRREQINIKEIVKNPSFMQKLTNELNEVEKDFFENCFIDNQEFKRILKVGVKKSKNVFNEILDKNFNFNTNIEIYEIVHSELIKIEDELIKRKDEFEAEVYKKEMNRMSPTYNFTRFKESYKNEILKPEVKSFAKQLFTICKEQKNGVRRKNYHNLCVQLVGNILEKSQIFYVNFQ